jgi:branched-chain amino acid transport system permease protein
MSYLLQTLVDALNLGSLYALAALGIGLLFGMLRLVNFAHGDLISLCAYALILPAAGADIPMPMLAVLPVPLLIAAVMLVGALAANAADVAVFRPLRKGSVPTLMIASFAIGYVVQNVLLGLYGSRPKNFDLWPGLNHQIVIPMGTSSVHVPLMQLVTIAATGAVMVGLTLLLRHTRYGVQMRAAAEDFRMASYLGVRGNLVVGLAFALSGALAGIVSLLYVSQTGALLPTMGVPLMLYAFIATVVGGMGSLIGAVLGGFLIGAAAVLLQSLLPPDLRPFRDAFVFAVVLAMLLLRPGGLVRSQALTERV